MASEEDADGHSIGAEDQMQTPEVQELDGALEALHGYGGAGSKD